MKQLICDSLNGMRITQIILATAICTPESESEVAQSCLTLCDPMDNRLLCPWDFLGKSTEVACHCLLGGFKSKLFPFLSERCYCKDLLNIESTADQKIL